MDRNYEVIIFISKYLYFKEAGGANFVDIIEIGIMPIKKALKD